jgi:hypothetical protein
LSQPSERTRDPHLEQRRGRRNFLTWAFFLAQVSAAEALVTGAARTQDDDDWVNPAQGSDLPPDDLPNEILQQRMEVAEAATDARPSSSSPGMSPLTPLVTPGQTQVGPIGGHTPSPGTVGAGAAASSAQGRVGSSGNLDSALPDMLPDLHFGIQMAPQPLHADVSLALLGFELNGDAGGLVSANLGLDLNNLIPDPLKGVTDLLDSLTSDLANLLDGDGLVGGLLGGIPETNAPNLGELTGLMLTNGIAGLLGQRDQNAPAAAQSESDAGQTGAFVTDADEFSAPALLSGGMINFPNATTNAPSQINELFAEGRHTNYNIALGETSERDSADASPAQPDTPALPEGTPPPDDQPQNDVSIAEQSPLDEFVTRPAV